MVNAGYTGAYRGKHPSALERGDGQMRNRTQYMGVNMPAQMKQSLQQAKAQDASGNLEPTERMAGSHLMMDDRQPEAKHNEEENLHSNQVSASPGTGGAGKMVVPAALGGIIVAGAAPERRRMPVDLSLAANELKNRRVSQVSDQKSKNIDDQPAPTIKFARGGSVPASNQSHLRPGEQPPQRKAFQLKPHMSRTHFLSSTRNDPQPELTLSLPSMGPNFNFYKFKGISEAYQSKFRATQRNLRQVNTVLASQWGQQLKNYNRYGISLRSADMDGELNLQDGEGRQSPSMPLDRAVVMDNKGISPLTASPRAAGEHGNSKDGLDFLM